MTNMKEEVLDNILAKLETIDKRLANLENTTTNELQKLHVTVDLLKAEQREDVIPTLQHIDAKMTAILETQKLNFEILRVFSGDLVQH